MEILRKTTQQGLGDNNRIKKFSVGKMVTRTRDELKIRGTLGIQ